MTVAGVNLSISFHLRDADGPGTLLGAVWPAAPLVLIGPGVGVPSVPFAPTDLPRGGGVRPPTHFAL